MRIIEAARKGMLHQPTYKLERIMWGILGTVALLTALLLWSHVSSMNELQRQLHDTNEYRERAQKLLKRHQRIQEQQKQVNSVLEQDAEFKIKEYMNKLIGQQQLDKQAELGKPQERDVQKGYTEAVLDVSVSRMSMKELVMLMQKTEQNERVYLKSLTINQRKQEQKIDATLTVATLHMKES